MPALCIFLNIFFDEPQSGITPPAYPIPSVPFKFMANVKGNHSSRSFALLRFLQVPDTQYDRNTLPLLLLPALVFRTLIYGLRRNALQFLKQRWQEERITSVLLLEEVHEEAEPDQEDSIPD